MITSYVYTRVPILSSVGHFIWAEYHPGTGEFVSELAEATTGDWAPEQWRVMSGTEYQRHIEQSNGGSRGLAESKFAVTAGRS